MCGRYGLTIDQESLALGLAVERATLDWEPRYNIAPTQDAPVLREDDDGPRLDPLRWGLVPFWADDPSIGNRMINARAETVASKPAFRAAFRARRCLVPASGFYEWAPPERQGGAKQPYWIHPAEEGELLTFAGLWERWESPTSSPLLTFTILTTEANDLLRPIHGRMPVIIPPEDRKRWTGEIDGPERLTALLRPLASTALDLHPVDRYVNRPSNEGPRCIEPVGSDEAAEGIGNPG